MPPPVSLRPIDSLMRRHFISVAPEDPVEEVLHLMAFARLRFLPVVNQGVLVGLVGYRTLALSYLGSSGDHEGGLIADVMERPRGTVRTKALTRAAAHELCENGHGCVPVVEPCEAGLRIVGLVTENDLLRAAYRSPSAASTPPERASG